ncbi:thymidylate synthase [Streptomyces sp. NPDC006640]|uniref:thymidylate synthase n=1 Tax=unclassified Streptomyces TaxID=2593676 RepID=UPI00369FA84B
MERGRPVWIRGEWNREVLAADIVITEPTDRLPIVVGRRSNTAFCVVEFLWYCAQRTDLASLEPYAPKIRSYYGGDCFVTGSDYGGQIFGDKVNGSQWSKVVALLRKDSGSKRAFIGIYSPDDVVSLLPENHDLSCTAGFQVLVRDGKLHWITTMRANDAYRGFVSDTFSFTLLQELLAATLDIPVGQYLHRPASLHTFDEDVPSIKRILSAWHKGRRDPIAMPRMPAIRPIDFWQRLGSFWAVHDNSRLSGDWSSLRSLHGFSDSWWSWVASALLDFHEVGEAV